nr:CsbA family protein [Bacillus fonticola]
MMDKTMAAFFLPGLLVFFFTRITYNHYVGLLITLALISASAYKGYTHGGGLVWVDALSLTVGFYFARRWKLQQEKAESSI